MNVFNPFTLALVTACVALFSPEISVLVFVVGFTAWFILAAGHFI